MGCPHFSQKQTCVCVCVCVCVWCCRWCWWCWSVCVCVCVMLQVMLMMLECVCVSVSVCVWESESVCVCVCVMLQVMLMILECVDSFDFCWCVWCWLTVKRRTKRYSNNHNERVALNLLELWENKPHERADHCELKHEMIVIHVTGSPSLRMTISAKLTVLLPSYITKTCPIHTKIILENKKEWERDLPTL